MEKPRLVTGASYAEVNTKCLSLLLAVGTFLSLLPVQRCFSCLFTSCNKQTPVLRHPHSAQGWWFGRVLLLGCRRSSPMLFTSKTGKAKSARHWVWCGGTSGAQGRKSYGGDRQEEERTSWREIQMWLRSLVLHPHRWIFNVHLVSWKRVACGRPSSTGQQLC